jgi:phospho-N-acetylmuramoyl-pentapeptide-transferase
MSNFILEMTGMLAIAMIGFLLAMALTPIYTYFAYKYKFWKKQRTEAVTGEKLEVFTKLHADKFSHGRVFPTMAGIVSVIAILAITLIFNFSRGQTWLLVAALFGGAFLGLVDDIINVFGVNILRIGFLKRDGVAGLRAPVKFIMLTILGLFLGWFFYAKLGVSEISVPFLGVWHLGIGVIFIFAFAVVATGNAVNITDGLDGLAGGLLALAFAAFGIIATAQGNFGIATFCWTCIGVLIAYLWFNVYPARFMMGDVGSFAFGAALGVVAMETGYFFLLPIICGVFVIEAGSSLIQMISKKFFHRKIFPSAPIHQTLQLKWGSEVKVTMRLWIIGAVLAITGIVLALGGFGWGGGL